MQPMIHIKGGEKHFAKKLPMHFIKGGGFRDGTNEIAKGGMKK